jgi:hypothetical protein
MRGLGRTTTSSESSPTIVVIVGEVSTPASWDHGYGRTARVSQSASATKGLEGVVASFPWHCPFCGHDSTVGEDNYTVKRSDFADFNKYGRRAVIWTAVTCPNPKCREYSFSLLIRGTKNKLVAGEYELDDAQHSWQLVPAARTKILPDYVPAPIVADYKEACLIADLSPKASATLSRRFWGINKPKLVQEIDAIKDKVDDLAWNAIDGLRKMGNIGAHMEKDRDRGR